ncbi:MAG TPA: serine hydrolase [Candidatus Kapabacteria bacterium]|nr:serine hydrolase [Candidatus Kapabacteria bacterium]
MNRLLLFLLFLLFGLSFAVPTLAQDLTPEFKRFFDAVEKDTLFNGNILIAQKGKVVYQRSIGYADFSTQRKLDENSIFELASVSKQFTAMGVMLLVEEGKIGLDDSLRRFFPELPYYGITIRHLLNHTSGLPDYMEHMMKSWPKHKIANNDDMIAELAKKRPALLFTPGEKYEYSNTGYALLASMIEKASGKNFGEYLEAKIFRPLGMKNTFVYTRRCKPQQIANYAFGYVRDRSRLPILPDSSVTANYVYQFDGIVGDGTVNSTLGDLLKWDRALHAKKLLNKRSYDQIFARGRLNNGDSTNYGFGWQLSYDSVLGPRHFHSGGWPGYATFISRYPESDWTVIVLRNAESPVGLSFVLGDLTRIIKQKPALYTQPTISMAESSAKPYEGTYRLEEGFDLTFSIDAGKYYVQATGQPRGEVFPSSLTTFFSRRSAAEFEFVIGEDVKASRMIFTQGSSTRTCERVN